MDVITLTWIAVTCWGAAIVQIASNLWFARRMKLLNEERSRANLSHMGRMQTLYEQAATRDIEHFNMMSRLLERGRPS